MDSCFCYTEPTFTPQQNWVFMTVLFSSTQPATAPYLQKQLTWLHALLHWQVQVTRATYATLADDPYRGLYLPDQEIDILTQPWPPLSPELAEQQLDILQQYARLWADQHVSAGFQKVAEQFGLTSIECAILLCALAPELDPRYERLYGYIQDDVNKKRPSVDLLGRLLCTTHADKLALRTLFAPTAPLVREQLIFFEHSGNLGSQFVRITDCITAALLDHDQPDQTIAPWITVHQAQDSLQDLILPTDWVTALQQLLNDHPAVCLGLSGAYGSGRRAIAAACATERGVPLLELDLSAVVFSDRQPAEILARVRRELLLRNALLLLSGADQTLRDQEHPLWRIELVKWLEQLPGTSLIALGPHPWHAPGLSNYLLMPIPEPGFGQREQLWRRHAGGLADSTYEQLSSTFRLNSGQIRDAARLAQQLARLHGLEQPTETEIYAACRAQSGDKLAAMARKIEPTYTWSDLVVPDEVLTQLQEICVQVRQRRTVLERWGFDRHLAMGKGINGLFAGPSGTGKTMAAEVIAADLGLDVYKVNLATLVSKYIGETEKNLERIFEAARETNAILFFDEADSIFGKRSEVRDAHDRYANIEVGYLLQKMEQYDGIVILATNLRKNMDDAFVRRLHAAIEFPFPEEIDRLQIWQKVFPAATPLADNLDLEFMAQQFRLSGGNIRNIALLAAFLAAEDQAALAMSHLIRATRREYQKLGRLITEAAFGPYITLVRQEGNHHGRF